MFLDPGVASVSSEGEWGLNGTEGRLLRGGLCLLVGLGLRW